MIRMLQDVKKLIPERHPLRLLWHYGKALLAATLYGFPARKLKVIGVTGTDGKTTTVGMLTSILERAGFRVGAVSTAYFHRPLKHQENASHLTSISPFVLQRFLRTLLSEECTHVVIECSSHGLVQGRLHYTWPSVTAITNTSPEHLDYHGSMEQYRRDKGMLFRMLRRSGTKVLNGDDATFALYRPMPSERTVVYSARHQDPDPTATISLWLTHTDIGAAGSAAILHLRQGTGTPREFLLCLAITGLFNLENALCAIACTQAMGIPITTCLQALRTFSGIPGRLERIEEGQPFDVFVDFAVTAKAYEKTLTTLRTMVEPREGRVLVLCSCCGNRMREKRPEVGRVCSAFADVVVVTEDETYGEDPYAVLEEVWAGVDQKRTQAFKIFDRREAIAFLLREAKPGDAVVLCGMGPFTTMTRLEGRIPWDEREVARELLRELLTTKAKVLNFSSPSSDRARSSC